MADETSFGREGAATADMVSRTRVLEGKYNLLRDRVLVINQNMIDEYKRLLIELKGLNSDIKDVRDDVFKIKEALKHLIKELDLFARKEDVKVLEKYINLWNPMKFTTEQDVINIIKEHSRHKEQEAVKKYGAKKR